MSAPIPSVAQLLARYPEFEAASLDYPALLTSVLEEAAAETSDWAFPSAASQTSYVLCKAAIALYRSPFARTMRYEGKMDKVRDLERELYQKASVATMGLRVF